MHGGADAADQHHLAGVPAQDAHHQIGARRLPGVGLGRVARLPVHNQGVGFALRALRRLVGRCPPARASWSPETAAWGPSPARAAVPETAEGLQLQRGVAQLQILPVAQQEVAVLEHPQVARPVVNGPQRLGLDRARRQAPAPRRESGARRLPLSPCLAAHQSRHAKGEQQPVFIQKVQRNQAVALAQVDGSGRGKAQRLDGNGECGRLRGLVGSRSGSASVSGLRRLRCWPDACGAPAFTSAGWRSTR
jgi:hypothetical protein